MRLEQAILDRLEKRNAQIAQLQSTVHALERAADSQREHARQEQERLRDARQRLDDLKLELREEAGKRWNAIDERDALAQENTKLGARIERMEESAASAELLRKSLNAEITKRDHELRAHEKELAEQREEIRKLMDGHAEDLKAQAELLAKYEKILAQVADLGSYAMTLGRNEGEPLEMFMERLALRIAAIESRTRPLHDEIARLNAKVGPLEKLYQALKKHVDNGAILNRGDLNDAYAEIDKSLSQLTA